ncbi:hypothetical protein CGMCC3_g2390 [Colletotrichum fructicola]|nr:uncharacterized protein CGMCC3_g2390 [Colletotrichum fructicola]KAE9581938.1 hypothetical protein CGMCC3_g2390 [Colletotrichum fructicola]
MDQLPSGTASISQPSALFIPISKYWTQVGVLGRTGV